MIVPADGDGGRAIVLCESVVQAESPDELVQHVHVPQGGLGGCQHVETLIPLRGMLGLSEIVTTRMFEQFIEAMKVPTNSYRR